MKLALPACRQPLRTFDFRQGILLVTTTTQAQNPKHLSELQRAYTMEMMTVIKNADTQAKSLSISCPKVCNLFFFRLVLLKPDSAQDYVNSFGIVGPWVLPEI